MTDTPIATMLGQAINTDGGDLRSLDIFIRNNPESFDHPDSDTFTVAASILPSGGIMGADFKSVGPMRPRLDDWNGDDTGEDVE